MTILVLDGHNLMHRARSGFQLGDHAVTYNFFRQLKSLVEQFKPTRVYFTLEGAPVKRLAMLPTYKANRAGDPNDAKALAATQAFLRQKDEIVGLLTTSFPVSVIRHPSFEADDVIANVVRRSSSACDFVVVSTDTDFIQLLQSQHNVRLYNPVTKLFVEPPSGYSYVHWKALRGDASDNVPAVAGMTDAKATLVLSPVEPLSAAEKKRTQASVPFLNDPILVEQWRRNCDLIRFHEWTDDEAMEMTSSSPTCDWEAVRRAFDGWGFASLTKDAYWTKLVATFDPLWGPRR